MNLHDICRLAQTVQAQKRTAGHQADPRSTRVRLRNIFSELGNESQLDVFYSMLSKTNVYTQLNNLPKYSVFLTRINDSKKLEKGLTLYSDLKKAFPDNLNIQNFINSQLEDIIKNKEKNAPKEGIEDDINALRKIINQ